MAIVGTVFLFFGAARFKAMCSNLQWCAAIS